MKIIKEVFKFYNFLIFLLILSCFEIIFLVKQNRQLRKIIISYNQNNQNLKKGDILNFSSLKDLNGNHRKLQNYLTENNHLFLLFFSTNCSACEKDIQIWREIHLKSQNSKFSFIGISLDDEFKTKRFAHFNKLDFDILIDDDKGTFFRINNVRSVPTLALVNEYDLIENVWIGAVAGKKNINLNKILDSTSTH